MITRLKKDPVDRHVGLRLKERRLQQGMSQEKLATAVGVSFQQIQKYENGTNRVGAGRLMQVAQALHVPVSFFFENGTADSLPTLKVAEGTSSMAHDMLEKKETVDLLTAYFALPEAERAAVMAFIAKLKETGAA